MNKKYDIILFIIAIIVLLFINYLFANMINPDARFGLKILFDIIFTFFIFVYCFGIAKLISG